MKHAYVLERSTRELDRLELRGIIYRDTTRRALMSGGIEAGLGLYRTFRSAKLPAPEMRMEAPLGSGADSLVYRYMAESVRSMIPMADVHEIGGFSLEKVALLEAQLRGDVASSGGVLVCWPVVSAWCRKET